MQLPLFVSLIVLTYTMDGVIPKSPASVPSNIWRSKSYYADIVKKLLK
jgi:hypothetical protein